MSNNLTAAKNALDNTKNPLTNAINCSNKNIARYKGIKYVRHYKTSNTFQITLKNLGTINKNRITMNINGKAINLWFSYETIVAFKKDGEGIKCIQNQWGPTTSKLLNEICPNKLERLSEPIFTQKLNKLLII